MKKKEINSKPFHSYKLNDILFIVSSIIFNIGVSGVYIAVKIDSSVLLMIFGVIVVLYIWKVINKFWGNTRPENIRCSI